MAKKTFSEIIAGKIRKARADAGMSQYDLALAIKGWGHQISNYERGKVVPTAEIVQRIAKATGKPVGFFFGEKVAE